VPLGGVVFGARRALERDEEAAVGALEAAAAPSMIVPVKCLWQCGQSTS
jgi:hypothetical protein